MGRACARRHKHRSLDVVAVAEQREEEAVFTGRTQVSLLEAGMFKAAWERFKRWLIVVGLLMEEDDEETTRRGGS
jgi:hypothetical protein